ncbi:hypothetical protein H2200_006134 [Cladophialophora chaetospira]|uniref:Heterokaryon incompatibility domain-containing protein n=1 Tax=Cladophialophora chaetospira TaxID=386627 RepID=A0AA38XAH5_9EURO|nr:hypothetical protein H2200_006134 [Cladophialophora chaetospira]
MFVTETQPGIPAKRSSIYQDKPLPNPSTHIRILRIQAPGDNGLLRCSLEVCALEARPFYVALSYEWGDPSLEVDIELDGKIHRIRHNLFLLLQQLLLKEKSLIENGQLRLWVDALCINQANLEEKGHQIARMESIFRQADSVIAWLGWVSEWSLQAFKHISSLPERLYYPQNELNYFEADDLTLPAKLKLVLRLLKLSYWERRWILQELHLAREVTVLSNAGELPWFKFQHFFRKMDEWKTDIGTWQFRTQGHLVEADQVLHEISQTVAYKMWKWEQVPRALGVGTEDVLGLLQEFRDTKSALNRDRVYSLLSFLPEHDRVPADYNCPLVELPCRLSSSFEPRAFKSHALLSLVEELRIKLPSALEPKLNNDQCSSFLHGHFSMRHLDLVQFAGSSDPTFEAHTRYRDFKTFLDILPSFPDFRYSFVEAFSLQQEHRERVGWDTRVANSHSWIWCTSSNGFLVYCPGRTVKGDFLLPLTERILLVVFRSADTTYHIIGVACCFDFAGPRSRTINEQSNTVAMVSPQITEQLPAGDTESWRPRVSISERVGKEWMDRIDK